MPKDEEAPKKKNTKRLSVERIYQKKSQLEHILLRPDSYIGSAEPCTQNMWIWDDENNAIISKSITYTPGLYKIFDEILGMYCLVYRTIDYQGSDVSRVYLDIPGALQRIFFPSTDSDQPMAQLMAQFSPSTTPTSPSTEVLFIGLSYAMLSYALLVVNLKI